jgi:hypothetical protein
MHHSQMAFKASAVLPDTAFDSRLFLSSGHFGQALASFQAGHSGRQGGDVSDVGGLDPLAAFLSEIDLSERLGLVSEMVSRQRST